MTNNACLNPRFTAVAQQVLHEDLWPQMSEGKAAPLDVSLNELVPTVAGNPGVVFAARAEVNDVLYTRPFRRAEKIFTLLHHFDGVASKQERERDYARWKSDDLDLEA
jgi:hypothetical protein